MGNNTHFQLLEIVLEAIESYEAEIAHTSVTRTHDLPATYQEL